MRGGFSIGRIFGIRIRIDWSWLLIFFLITWNMASTFGQIQSELDVVLRWALAAVASLLFFASVLAHELAHSLMAKAQDVPVRSITLFLFGGVSSIEREPPSPRAELLITVVGPITSIVLGAILLVLASAIVGPVDALSQPTAETFSQFSPVTLLVLWLGSINLLLGVFNLIPGFPLDGGRVLRSILWALTDNLRRATRWASLVGQAMGWLMIIAGVAIVFGLQIPFLGSGFVSGLWLIFIGWFLNSAAIQSYRQVVIQDILEGVPVSRMMRVNPPTVPPDCTVSDLVHEHIMGSDDHAFPVVEDDRFLALVTLEDVRKIAKDQWDTTTVRQIMTPVDELTVVDSDDDAGDALSKLMGRDVRQLPVLDNGHLAGLLRRRDLVRWLQLQSEEVLA